MQMIRSGGVDDDLVRWIGRDDRGVALQDPEREAVKRRCVCIRRGVLDDEAGHLCLRRRHPDAQAGGLGRSIRRDQTREVRGRSRGAVSEARRDGNGALVSEPKDSRSGDARCGGVRKLKFDAFKTDMGIVGTRWKEERPIIFKTNRR